MIRFEDNPATLALSTGSHPNYPVYTIANSATTANGEEAGTFRVNVFDGLGSRHRRTDSAVTVVLP